DPRHAGHPATALDDHPRTGRGDAPGPARGGPVSAQTVGTLAIITPGVAILVWALIERARALVNGGGRHRARPAGPSIPHDLHLVGSAHWLLCGGYQPHGDARDGAACITCGTYRPAKPETAETAAERRVNAAMAREFAGIPEPPSPASMPSDSTDDQEQQEQDQ